jgi:hypothetical protein
MQAVLGPRRHTHKQFKRLFGPDNRQYRAQEESELLNDRTPLKANLSSDDIPASPMTRVARDLAGVLPPSITNSNRVPSHPLKIRRHSKDAQALQHVSSKYSIGYFKLPQ